MANYKALTIEIQDDPLVIGYSAMGNQALADNLNALTRNQDKAIMAATEVFNAVAAAEWNALGASDKVRIWDVLHMGEINPFGLEATVFTNVFGAGSDTIIALAAARKEAISRAIEIGFGRDVTIDDVAAAR